MKESELHESQVLTEHFFRNEYGKIVSVITRYLGVDHVQTAEDVVQETLSKATEIWPKTGVPENPEAWLYMTAKNLALNILRHQKHVDAHKVDTARQSNAYEQLEKTQFSHEAIQDEQLKMMFVCCHTAIPENAQIALILKVLCGFSIAEIASAFLTSKETINKRLVRARQTLREHKVTFDLPIDPNLHLPQVLKAIYLLFNEGYSPSHRSHVLNYDLCLEAVRLGELLVTSKSLTQRSESFALLSLMYFNASRFQARTEKDGEIVVMEAQDRSLWNQEMVNRGITYLEHATEEDSLSQYLILATISAHHCIAVSAEKTDWKEILKLYDHFLTLEDSPLVRLNRSVAIAQVSGPLAGLNALEVLASNAEITEHFLFQATIASFYEQANQLEEAIDHFGRAVALSQNERDSHFFKNKIATLVPLLKTDVS